MDKNNSNKIIEVTKILEVVPGNERFIKDEMETLSWNCIGRVIDKMAIQKNHIKQIIINNENISNYVIFRLSYNKLLVKYYDTNKEALQAYDYYKKLIS